MSTAAEQADEVGREVRQRERLYPDWIARGRLKEETADRKLDVMRDAEQTLRFIANHAAGLRALCHFLLATGDSRSGSRPPVETQPSAAGSAPAESPTAEETAALLAHPGVKALLDVWPDAEVRILGAVQPPLPPDASQPDFFADERETA